MQQSLFGEVCPDSCELREDHRLGVVVFSSNRMRGSVALAAVVGGFGCGGSARLPVDSEIGPTPALPAPATSLIPTVNIAAAKGWPSGARPQSATGTTSAAFA